MTIRQKTFKQNIADVLPMAKRSEKDGHKNISRIRVFGDGKRTIMQATDRFAIVNTIIAEEEREPFEVFFTLDTLASAKAQPAGTVTISTGGLEINNIKYPAATPVEWPNIDQILDGAWGDDDYFTPGSDPAHAEYNIAPIKHIKDVEIIPRHNRPHAPTRFKAGERAYGVIQPKRVK